MGRSTKLPVSAMLTMMFLISVILPLATVVTTLHQVLIALTLHQLVLDLRCTNGQMPVPGLLITPVLSVPRMEPLVTPLPNRTFGLMSLVRLLCLSLLVTTVSMTMVKLIVPLLMPLILNSDLTFVNWVTISPLAVQELFPIPIPTLVAHGTGIMSLMPFTVHLTPPIQKVSLTDLTHTTLVNNWWSTVVTSF